MKRLLRNTFSLCLLAGAVFPLFVFAQDSLLNSRSINLPIARSSVLPAEQAFALNNFIEAPDTAVLFWEIEDGYYLYKKSISATDAAGNEISMGELAEGTTVTDEFFGEVEVYFDRLFIRFPLSILNNESSSENNIAAFTLHYQGCAEDLYCYPMLSEQIQLELPD